MMQVDDTLVKIYSIGQFFVPCWGADLVCTRHFEKSKAAGNWDMADLVGRHWFAGSWNKPALLKKEEKKTRHLLQSGRHLEGWESATGWRRLQLR